MTSPTPLKFLMPGWFSVVMGLCGLSLAWHRAQRVFGDMADGVALVVLLVAALVFVVLLVASVLRAQRYPAALADDLRHPGRHAFVAAFPVAVLLLAAVGVALMGPSLGWNILWWLGALTQIWATAWVMGRWLAPATPGQGPGNTGLWPGITPALMIPVVGNVVVPLAGLPLEHTVWSAAQFGMGVFFWPAVLVLVLVRRIAHSPLPDRLLPTWFIVLAAPAVIGNVLAQWQTAPLLVVGMWGLSLFFLVWLLPIAKRVAAQPFGLTFWSLSFPLAALSSLTLRVGDLYPDAAGVQTIGVLLLAVTSMVILWLGFATVRGLRDGTLLAPEPLANIQPVSA